MRHTLLAAAMLLAACTGGASPAAAPTEHPIPATGNLIVNPGAETGKGSTDGGVVPVPGWEVTGKLTVNEYDTPGSSFLRSTDPGPPDRGRNYFAGGPGNEASSASQTINVSSRAAAIDRGGVTYTLSAWLGGWETQDDNAIFTISFVDKDGRLRGTASIGPVLAADRQRQTGLLLRTTSGPLPAFTRSIQATLVMTRTAGDYNDGYADSLVLLLSG
jgi:hypothetical protein